MPELPEVEAMAERLHRWAAGQVVMSVTESVPEGSRKQYMAPLRRELFSGHRIEAVHRHGKQLRFQLAGGAALYIHNAMSGYWDSSDEPWAFDYVEGRREPGAKDVRIAIELESGRVLRFHDSRMFGRFEYFPATDRSDLLEFEARFGPDPIETPRSYPGSPVLSPLELARRLAETRPKWELKRALMDQATVGGIGNIYAAEALWLCNLDPWRRVDDVPIEHLELLGECIRAVLKAAIERRLDYSALAVYRRKECDSCGTAIANAPLAGRTTYYCPTCQKGARAA